MQLNSATNSILDIHDLFLIFSRFTAKDFCISRLTEYTSITIHGTDFYQIAIHRAQKNRITASQKYPCPPPPPLSPPPSLIQPLVQNAFCDGKKTVAVGRNKRLRLTRYYFLNVNFSCLSVNAIFVAQEKKCI